MPILIGAFLLGRKLLTLAFTNRPTIDLPYSNGVAWDSSATPKSIGPVIDYDQFRAPRIIFRDDANKLGVLLGVRTNRFTSVSKVYYSGSNCTGTPYVRSASSLKNEVGMLYELQGLNYAMGNGNILYKEGVPAPDVTFDSVWASQDNGDAGSPAFTPSTACSNVTIGTGSFIVVGLAALSSVGTTATGVYGTCCSPNPLPFPPPLSLVTPPAVITGAVISYSGSSGNPNIPLYMGTFTITITNVNPGTFTYTLPAAAGVFPQGQLQFVQVSGSLAAGGSFPWATAVQVADLDSATNFARPYRLSFPTPGTPSDPALPCPTAECGAPIPPVGLQCPNGECP